jgi:hypothetical protein
MKENDLIDLNQPKGIRRFLRDLKGERLAFLLVMVFMGILVGAAIPVIATVTQTAYDYNYGLAPTQNFECSIQFTSTDPEGVINVPRHGAPTAVDYVYWTTETPQTNGETVYFMAADYAEGDTWGQLTVTRVDLDGNDALTRDATAIVNFTYE